MIKSKGYWTAWTELSLPALWKDTSFLWDLGSVPLGSVGSDHRHVVILSPKDDQRLIHSIYAPENDLAEEHLFYPWCVLNVIYALSWSSGPTVIHVDVYYVANEVFVTVWVPPQTHTVG